MRKDGLKAAIVLAIAPPKEVAIHTLIQTRWMFSDAACKEPEDGSSVDDRPGYSELIPASMMEQY